MASLYRTAVLLGCLAVLCPALLAADRPDAEGIQLPTDRKAQQTFEAAQDYVRDEAWGDAVRLLQNLLDREDDVFMQVTHKDTRGQESLSWVSVRSQADRLLGSLPAEGLERYEEQFGPMAAELVKQAEKRKDPSLLAETGRRFLYTKAGTEALRLLAVQQTRAGDYSAAALAFARLQPRREPAKWTLETLFQATLAFRQTGDRANAERTWAELTQRPGMDFLRIDGKTMTLDQWNPDLNVRPLPWPREPDGWPLYRRDAARLARGWGGGPLLQKRWSMPTITSDQTRRLVIDLAVKQCENRGQAILPGFFPIVAGDKLIYRSFYGIHAVSLETGKRVWEADTRGSLDKLLGDAGKAVYVNQWAQQFVQMGKPNLLFENSTVGTLSADNERVYVVDDLSIPPYAPNLGFNPGFGIPQPSISGPLKEAISQSKLEAYGLKDGKVAWEIGGKSDRNDLDDLSDTLFLGPPLPVQGKLYVLTAKQRELRLLCLEPSRGEVLWAQPLGSTQTRVSEETPRRSWAAHLAYGEGILVCPTNAGAILGVDLLSHSLVWAHAYRPRGQSALDQQELLRRGLIPPGYQGNPTATEWKVAAPVIQDSKVIFTAPNGADVRCLNLRDGSLVWQVNRSDDDLYLGGVANGKVLVVGKKECRALDLNNGKELWRLATGLPSGQGVFSDNLYYLPLEKGDQGKDPEVCAIDVEKGQVFAHSRAHKYSTKDGKEVQDVPGNLLFADGEVISQTVSEVAAFPQLQVRLRQIEERLHKDPGDPVGLYERAELRFDRGDLEAAVKDLREALAGKPPEDLQRRARDKLCEVLTELLQRDFDTGAKYLEEYRELCKAEQSGASDDPKVVQRRLANYFALVGQGRERQGKLVEAFAAYAEFGRVSDEELVGVVTEPNLQVRPTLWAGQHIEAMLARATPEQRGALEQEIDRLWQAVDITDNHQLQTFVEMFGSTCRVGREARLALALRLREAKVLPEAERQLLLLQHQTEDVRLAARATETLARMYAQQGLLADAVQMYRVLARDFARVEVRDGQTGADLFDQLSTDKRFLPYLDDPEQAWGNSHLRARVERGQFQPQQEIFTFEPTGAVLPYFRRHQVSLELNFHEFRLIDRNTSQLLWKQDLTRTNFKNFIWAGNQAHPVRFPYQTVGHVLVLPLAHMVFALDPITRKVLWEKNLLGQNGTVNFTNVLPDPRDGSLQVVYQDGYIQKLGNLPVVSPAGICMQTRDGLVVVEPVTGATLWTRRDVSSRARIFGDDQYLLVVEENAEGMATGSRAFRLESGVSVPVPDFTAIYDQRRQVLGRRILASEAGKDRLTLRLYDVPSGKDVWKQEFPAKSVVLRSEENRLAGAVDPEGKVTVVDLDSGKQVLDAKVDPKYLDKVQDIRLLEDRNHFYLAFNGQPEAKGGVAGVAWSTLMPGSGLRSIPVNGPLYAFDRETGRCQWRTEVPVQMLILDQWAELPVVLCASRSEKMMARGLGVMQIVTVKVIAKRTGKLLLDQTEDGNNTQQFYALKADPQAGRIELVSSNLKVTLRTEPVPEVVK